MPAKATMLLLTAPPELDDLSAPFELHESPRARRMMLRIDVAAGVVRVIVPVGVGRMQALRFVGRHHDWVRQRVAALPAARPFSPGAVVPIMGRPHRLVHDPAHRGGPRVAQGADGPELRAGGLPEHFARRIVDFLKAEAKREISARAYVLAAQVQRRISAITIRDQRSRWGSCSAAGRLAFSWRLILTPEPVLDYVVAHEVAHLVEMNHAPAFWRLLGTLTPHTDMARAWLGKNRALLLRYGALE